MNRYHRGSGLGDLIPASGEGRALVEIKGRVGGKGAGMQRRRYSYRNSAERRFRNPVNYLTWPVNMLQPDSDTEIPTDKWYLMDVATNDSPGVEVLASFFPDSPMATRYGTAQTDASVINEVPVNTPMRVPINARPLWTTGEIRLNQRTAESILWKVAIFRLPLELALSATNSIKPEPGVAGVSSNQYPWFWLSQVAQDANRGLRPYNRNQFLPVWSRTFVLQPNYNGGTNMAAKTLKVKLRHKTGEAFNTDNTGFVLMAGTRSRGGFRYEDGADFNVNLRTSYVI